MSFIDAYLRMYQAVRADWRTHIITGVYDDIENAFEPAPYVPPAGHDDEAARRAQNFTDPDDRPSADDGKTDEPDMTAEEIAAEVARRNAETKRIMFPDRKD